jgi:hypothetical protein
VWLSAFCSPPRKKPEGGYPAGRVNCTPNGMFPHKAVILSEAQRRSIA